MGEATCAKCGASVEEGELVLSEAGEICPSCELDAEIALDSGAFTSLNVIAVLFGVAPFLASYVTGAGLTQISFGLHTNLSTQGQDHVAFVGGLVALLAGAAALRESLQSNERKSVMISAAALGLGTLHVLARSGYLY